MTAMTRFDDRTRGPGWPLVPVLALLVLLLSGAGFRALEGVLREPHAPTGPIQQLATFPMTFAEWTGRDTPIRDEIVRAAGVDAYLSRSYSSAQRRGTINLYVGYGLKVRDLVPHRPTVCYPGAGWTLACERSTALSPTNGALDCMVYRFTRGALDAREVTVLAYYVIDGATYPDVAHLRYNAWRRGRIGYVAQIQVSCSDAPSDEADQAVCEFVRQAAGDIQNLFCSAPSQREP